MTNKERLKELEVRIEKLEKVAHEPKTFVTLEVLFKFQEEITKRITKISGLVAKELELRRPPSKASMPKKSPWHEKKKFSVEKLTKGRWEALSRAQQKSQSEGVYELTTNEEED